MSFDTKKNTIKCDGSTDNKSLLSRSASCSTLHSKRITTSIPTSSVKIIGTVRKSRVISKSSLKDENDDSSYQRFKMFKGHGLKNSKCLFYELDGKEVDLGGLTRNEIDNARTTGILKITRRFLQEVPEFVWSIELPTEEDRKIINVRFDRNDNHPWWTFKPLEYLDVSHNSLKNLSPKGSALYSLKELHVNNNSIVSLSNEIGECKELKILSLHNNNLGSLPDSIGSLTNLTELLLQKNNINELPGRFGELYGLKKLDISYNKLKKIPSDFGYLSGLVELYVSHNEAEIFPEEIQSLRALKILDVSNNNFCLIPSLNDMSNLTIFLACNNNIIIFPNFCGCRRLTEIRLENNQLKSLVIDNLQGVPLNKLLLRGNDITVIPEDISRLSTLVLLDISKNQLRKLPHQLAQLRNLSQLIVNENPIEDIRQDILKNGTARIIAHLKRLSMSFENRSDTNYVLKQLQPEIRSVYEKSSNDISRPVKMDMRTTHCLVLTNLELSSLSEEILEQAKQEQIFRIDLSRNKFLAIPDGLQSLCSNLTEIIIMQNNLTTVPDFIGDMKFLLHLDISYNKIETLPDSMANCRLKGLIAECNCFVGVPEVVYSIISLEQLNFGSNKISEINVKGINNLKYLFSLDLSNNNIDKVPPELGTVTQIKELKLFGNRFKLPRYSLLTKGTDAVMAYLRDKTATHEN